MRISVSSDMNEPVARLLVEELRRRGHEVRVHGALEAGADPRWAVCSEAAARDVAAGAADQAVVCCWTGTGASIAANKVPGVRAALCTDAYTADGARRWNDANVLALGLRLTSEPVLREILDAWFTAVPSEDPEDRENVARVGRLEEDRRVSPSDGRSPAA
ncbi:RpiB/LacA/LacB family sugar-phosphate isomerase [Streptomyces sp. NPDC058964]|uniref:RpiB/LacA/LacB family sugar-phosphate isomerase n=1 Tax=Streptomyces sp. NPDC058964 TaxID=3346681 RepID=UPI0036BB47E4